VLLEQMSARLHAQLSFESAVNVILADSIALHGAELGNVQLLAGEYLVIVLQRGFKAPFLEFFREVQSHDGTACGRSLRTREPVLVSDIETDEEYAAYRALAREAGYRSVITVPLITSTNFLLGCVSNHFVNIHKPTMIELSTLQSYSKIAADYLLNLLGEMPLKDKALEMNVNLYRA
jgi:GAF domain-containing protein